MSVDSDTITALRAAKTGKSYRGLARELGFAESFAGTLSDVLNQRDDHVSAVNMRRIRRALCLEPAPRKLHRVVLSEGQYRRWRALTPEQRKEMLGE